MYAISINHNSTTVMHSKFPLNKTFGGSNSLANQSNEMQGLGVMYAFEQLRSERAKISAYCSSARQAPFMQVKFIVYNKLTYALVRVDCCVSARSEFSAKLEK